MGFASMTKIQIRVIGHMGGKAAWKKGTAHKWTSQEARKAGRKGARALHAKNKMAVVETASPIKLVEKTVV